jgi:hypothetical protein
VNSFTDLILSLSGFILSSTSDGAPEPERIGHLHLEGRGSDKITLAVHGDHLRVPQFANQEGAWHAWTADHLHGLTTPARMSCDIDADDSYYASVVAGQKRLKDRRVRDGGAVILDSLTELARSVAKTMSESKIISMILDGQHGEPADIWKLMSCAVLLAEQHGGAWRSKEAVQLRSMGYYSKEQVLKELGVIAWPNDCSEPITLERDSL